MRLRLVWLALLLLTAASACRGEEPEAPRPEASTVRQAVRDELASGRYIQTPDERERLYARAALTQRIAQSITSFITSLFGGAKLPHLAWLRGDFRLALIGLAVIAVLILLALLYLLARLFRLRREDDLRRAARGPEVGPNADDRDLLTLTARRALAAARRAAESGDHRTATRYAFYALLLAFRESDLLELDLRRTNREYLRMLDPERPERELFRSSLDHFEHKWYGLEPTGPSEYESFERSIARCVTGARGSAE